MNRLISRDAHPLLLAVAKSPSGMSFSLAAFVYLAYWRLVGKRTEVRLLEDVRSLAKVDVDTPRAFVRGSPSELLPIAELPDAAFEPWIGVAWHRPLIQSIRGRTGVVFFALVLAGVIIFTGAWRRTWWLFPTVFLPLTMLVAVGVPHRPRYFRVVPGRLDILKYGWSSQRPVATRYICLKYAGLSIDLTSMKDCIHIFSKDGVTVFFRKDIPQTLEFVKMLAWATITNSPTPDVPNDRLID